MCSRVTIALPDSREKVAKFMTSFPTGEWGCRGEVLISLDDTIIYIGLPGDSHMGQIPQDCCLKKRGLLEAQNYKQPLGHSHFERRSTFGVPLKSAGCNNSNELCGRSVASKLSPQQADVFFLPKRHENS